jgi:PadR family transcriptional regulator, regulatory protein AphA
MSLRHALLGFLTTEPSSGYRLAQEFGESAGWFWYASHSQIHPELKRLEDAGLVASEVEAGDARGTRTYRITDAGREELDRWLCEQATDYPPVRDVERIRLIFLDQQPVEVIRKHFEAHIDHHRRLLDTYSEQLDANQRGVFPRLVKRLAVAAPGTEDVVQGLKEIALEGQVMRAQTEIAWAENALRWLDERDAAARSDS